ncbi:MAG: hypothetical protein QOD45_1769, partial [Pseudonocardiales bacterium]|nr:hypothetical protein [Pseudonocardiales bacterium]
DYDVLIVDQAEELFTVADGLSVAEFDQAIAMWLARGTRLVLAIRADFFGRLAELPQLVELAGAATEIVAPLNEGELRRVITEPARRTGMQVEPELVEEVLDDVRGQPGALPLLSVALLRTWQKRHGTHLSVTAYRAAGGVHSALEASAEDAYADLSDAGRIQARRLLVRLAARHGGVWTRQPMPREHLAGAAPLVDEHTLDLLSRRRIVTLSAEHVALVHEALLEHWPRLRGWLDERAAVAELVDSLAVTGQAWAAGGRRDSDLIRGTRLHAALAWQADSPEDVSPLEAEFLDAADRAAQGELAVARERAAREARGRRRLRYVAAVLALVAVTACGGVIVAVRERAAEQRAALLADARRVAALSLTAPDLRTSLLLAAASYQLSPSDDARGALLAALERSGTARWRLATPSRDLFLGVDAAGAYVWTMDLERTVYRYAVASRRPVASFPARADEVAALSPDAEQLVVIGRSNYFDTAGDGRTSVLNARDGSTVAVLPVRAAGGQVSPAQAVYSTDGRWLAVAQAGAGTAPDGGLNSSPVIDVFDAVDYRRPPRQIFLDSPLRSLAAARDGLGVLTAAGTVQVVRLSDLAITARARRADLADQDPAAAPPAFGISPDGRYLVLTAPSDPAQPYLLDTRDLGGQPRALERVDTGVAAVAFSPTSTLLAVSAGDGAVSVFRTADASVLDRPLSAAPGQATQLAWSGTAGGDTGLYAAGRDGQIVSLDVTSGARLLAETGPTTQDAFEVYESGSHLVAIEPIVSRPGHAYLPVHIIGLDGRSLTTASLAMDPNDTVQDFSLDAAADRGLLITQDPRGVMHSSVFALPSGELSGRFTTTGIPSTYNNDVGVISPDGRTAIFGVANHTLAVYAMPTGTRLRSFDIHFAGPAADRHVVSPVSYAPDGRLLVIGQDTGLPPETPPGQSPPPANSASSSAPENQLVGLVDPGASRLDGQIGGFGELGIMDAAAWSRDGSRLAIGTLAGTVRVVSARDLAPISPVTTAVAGTVQSVSFSPDGSTLVTGGSDGRLALWDARTLQPIGPAIRASRDDDSWWAWFRGDGTITGYTPAAQEGSERWFTFPANPTAWVEAACRLAGDTLSRTEWIQYVGSTRNYRSVC